MTTEFGSYVPIYRNPPFYRLGESMEKAKNRNLYSSPMPPYSIYAQYLYVIIYEDTFRIK